MIFSPELSGAARLGFPFLPTPMTDVGQLLASLGLSQYAAAFEAQAVEIDQLVDLSDADIRELGVSALGLRKRLLMAIAERFTGECTPQVGMPYGRRYRSAHRLTSRGQVLN